jgi:hypothetical protein
MNSLFGRGYQVFGQIEYDRQFNDSFLDIRFGEQNVESGLRPIFLVSVDE